MKFNQELQGKKVLVSQVRSANSATAEVQDTLSALGLGRIGNKREHSLNACVWGMLRKVNHLVKVTEVA